MFDLIEKWGLDRSQLAALARVQRRSALEVGVSPSTGRRSRSQLLVAFYLRFAVLAVLGLAGAAGVVFQPFFLGMVFSYTLIMLVLTLTFLSYFTAVLLDTSDNRILLHLPISGRTLIASRILCIAEYAGLLALAVSLPTAIALAVHFGAVALLVFVFSVALMLIFLVAVTLAICLLALTRVKSASIRQGILYFETALIALFALATTVVMNADAPLLETVSGVSGRAGWYFYPPGWMAGLLDYALMEKTRFNSVLAATAVLAPIAGFVACLQLFAGRRFAALLSRLEVVSARSSPSTPKGILRRLGALSGQISVLINRDSQEQAVFDLTSKLMRDDQRLKLKMYPYIAVILINVAFVVSEFHDRPMQDLPLTAKVTFFLFYYVPLYLAIVAPKIQYSDQWRAAWCYQVLPFARPGVIVAAAMKAYIWKYVFPVYLLLLALSAAVWGRAVALDTLFAGAVALLVCVQGFWTARPALPYSKETAGDQRQVAGRIGGLALILVTVGLVAMHVVLKDVAGERGVLAGIVALAVAIAVTYRKLRVMSFGDIEAPDHHVGWHSSKT